MPLAIGLNLDFVKLFTEFNPHIYFGGDSVAFLGPAFVDDDIWIGCYDTYIGAGTSYAIDFGGSKAQIYT